MTGSNITPINFLPFSCRSYDETLVKAPAKTTPPTPPTRTSSMASSQSGSGSPDLAIIPTPDYGSSSQDETDRSEKHQLQLNPRTKTFSKRHPPHVEIFESFNPIDENQELHNNLHPPYYFDPPKPMVSIYEAENNGGKFQFQPKNVRFDTSVEHHLASHDYRVAHATRKALRYTTEMHKQLAVRSGLRKSSTSAASGSSSGISSSNMSSPRNLSSSEEEAEQQHQHQERHQRAKSPKKYPAPPPPPPPPAPPKNVTKGIH